MDKKQYVVFVEDGKGEDEMGIVRDYSEFLQNGEIIVTPPSRKSQFYLYHILDSDKNIDWFFNFGELHGKAVTPIRVRVWFGKCDYVELGYMMRKDGTYYYSSIKSFRGDQNKSYERSALARLHEKTEQCPEVNSLKLGWLLPDETKDAIEAELREATSGKYRFMIVWDRI